MSLFPALNGTDGFIDAGSSQEELLEALCTQEEVMCTPFASYKTEFFSAWEKKALSLPTTLPCPRHLLPALLRGAAFENASFISTCWNPESQEARKSEVICKWF